MAHNDSSTHATSSIFNRPPHEHAALGVFFLLLAASSLGCAALAESFKHDAAVQGERKQALRTGVSSNDGYLELQEDLFGPKFHERVAGKKTKFCRRFTRLTDVDSHFQQERERTLRAAVAAWTSNGRLSSARYYFVCDHMIGRAAYETLCSVDGAEQQEFITNFEKKDAGEMCGWSDGVVEELPREGKLPPTYHIPLVKWWGPARGGFK